MSDFTIGDNEYGWTLVARNRNVELWHNDESGNYGVYLYEHVTLSDGPIMHVIRKNKKDAEEIYAIVANLLK